jgi:hypothetical protein
LHDHISLLFLLYFGHGLSFLHFLLFLSSLKHMSLSSSFFFCIAHVSFSRTVLERERSYMELYFVEWMDDTMLTSSVEA